MSEPLRNGESVDLDSSIEVKRMGRLDRLAAFHVIDPVGDEHVSLTRQDVKTLAELAGYEVTDT